MSLRKKLIIGSLAIILALSGLYLGLSLAATDMVFGRYELYAQRQLGEQIKGIFASYYSRNGQSWEGVEEYIQPFMPPKKHPPRKILLALLDEKDRPVLIWPRGAEELWREAVEGGSGIKVPVVLNGNQVGTLWLPPGPPMHLEGIRSRVSESLVESLIIASLLSALMAFGVSFIMAGLITKPLKGLAEAARLVGRRRFDLRLPVTSRDEVGVVIQAFNNMSEELQRNEQASRNLVADVAHELRTPLSIIQGQLESIQQGVLPASVETVLPIQDEVIRLNRLVDDLRQLTLAEAGRLALQRESADLLRLVLKIVDNFQLEAEARGIDLQLDSPGSPVWAGVDPDRFTQIVVNILGNALCYTPPGRFVRIGLASVGIPAGGFDLAAWCRDQVETATAGPAGIDPCREAGPGTGVVVWVADQGPGIEAEKLPFVFDRFYRADESRDRGTGGIGLGLAIAREFVLAHGGQITACNRKGGGSLFAFFLPDGHRADD